MDEREYELREALDKMMAYSEENHANMERIWKELNELDEQRRMQNGDYSFFVPFFQQAETTILYVN